MSFRNYKLHTIARGKSASALEKRQENFPGFSLDSPQSLQGLPVVQPPPTFRQAVVLQTAACQKGAECNAQAPEALEADLWSYFY